MTRLGSRKTINDRETDSQVDDRSSHRRAAALVDVLPRDSAPGTQPCVQPRASARSGCRSPVSQRSAISDEYRPWVQIMHGTQLLDMEPVVERARDVNNRVREEVVARPVPACVIEWQTSRQRVHTAAERLTGVARQARPRQWRCRRGPRGIDPSVENVSRAGRWGTPGERAHCLFRR